MGRGLQCYSKESSYSQVDLASNRHNENLQQIIICWNFMFTGTNEIGGADTALSIATLSIGSNTLT